VVYARLSQFRISRKQDMDRKQEIPPGERDEGVRDFLFLHHDVEGPFRDPREDTRSES
jgi:hypothetical protein